MILIYKNFFDNEIINYILNLDDVIKSKEKLDKTNSQYFSIILSP